MGLARLLGKFYQPPPLETISGPLLAFAQSSDLGFLPLHGERDEEYQVGLTIPVSGWTLDLDHFRTLSQNFFDHNPIGNSNVFLPITITGAVIAGNEFTLRSPRFWAGEQVYITYSNQTADGTGAITGGLTDFTPPTGYYALDHDQRNTLNLGFRAQLPWQAYASMNLYFGSGFSNGDAPPSHLPSHGTLDVSARKELASSLSASVTVVKSDRQASHHLPTGPTFRRIPIGRSARRSTARFTASWGTHWPPASPQILPGQFPQPRTIKARIVAGVHQARGQ